MLSVLFQSFGGLALFLFGMKIMSEGLQKAAGSRMRHILSLVSNNRLVGCGVGTLVTSVIQSSSATTVMLVSFVDAGLISLTQAIGVILGANIGTTITAQLIAFKITAYALPAITTGVLLKFFLGHRRWVYIGDIILGFGLVFFGMATMNAGVAPLRDDPSFISFFTNFHATNIIGILLCILTGTALTMILQSSSATLGITMAFASQGLLNFETSVALVLGDNIGTTITAELASIGANINAHRTARAHTLFNVLGVIIIIAFFPVFIKLVHFITSNIMHFGSPDLLLDGEKPNISRYIANAHTIFNIVNAMIFLTLLNFLVKMATWLTPHKKGLAILDELPHIKHMDLKFIDTPYIALTQSRAEILRMGEAVKAMYRDVVFSLKERRLKELTRWKKREDAIDILQKEITQFLVKVTQASISAEESKEIRSLLRMTNNLERVGDAIEDIAESIEKYVTHNLNFSEEGMKDYENISNVVWEFLNIAVTGIGQENTNIMEKAFTLETQINKMDDEMKGNHLIRLQQGQCSIDPGLVFVDMLTAFERMGGFCFNIAQAVAGLK